MKNKNEILDLPFEFAPEIIAYCETPEERKKFVIARQLLKSGTSIGANVREAQNPPGRADLISKLIIAAKEADGKEYWLLLCDKSKNYPNPNDLLNKILSIKKLLSKIISSSKKGYN